ncbi:hypothetical protein FACUT_6250 [Fusarium acutatum]|uniref:Uncharacterized protein n=1 Tax=Fusarium acutatum TaxID=78861 RepID=A0A8H4JQS8_9HYPO|nr:hypothetical protein FACUT_6250 [Fusarium acutatum]
MEYLPFITHDGSSMEFPMRKDDKSTLTPYEARYGVDAVFQGDVELQRHKILHYIRGRLEAKYIHRVWYTQFYGMHTIRDLENIKEHSALSFCNKTFPIFLLADRISSSNRTLAPLIHIAVLNYIHRLYFKPYRTDIEYDQFLAKLLRLDFATLPDDSSAARLGLVLNRAICTRVDRALLGAEIPGRKHYSIRPLFRALSVVIQQSHYQSCGVISDISQLPVLLVLTGNKEGLHSDTNTELDLLKDGSEPEPISHRTTLGTVTTSIMRLQEQEDRISGPKPDPVESTDDPEMLKHLYVLEQFQAERMGWGKRPLKGPSSQWVDTHRYPIWTGEGARTGVLGACQDAERTEHAKVCKCPEPLSSFLTQDL